MATYHMSCTVHRSFDDTVAAVKEALGRHGFGVLTEIDVAATMKNKLDRDFRPYRILGACNPEMAWKALEADDKVGTMLPCNVVVHQNLDGMIEISAVDPVASFEAIENQKVMAVAMDVRHALKDMLAEFEEA